MTRRWRFHCVCNILISVFVLVPSLGCDRKSTDIDEPDEDVEARLYALGYVESTPDPAADRGKEGVIVYDPAAACPGINVYCSEKHGNLTLFDMAGTALHRFELPDLHCKLLEPYDEESFVILTNGEGILKIDWDSMVQWHNPGGYYHHDIAVAENGDIYTFKNVVRSVEYQGETLRFLDNSLAVLGPDGHERSTLSLYGLLGHLVPEDRFPRLYAELQQHGTIDIGSGRTSDIFHANSLEILQHDGPLGPRGALLISIRYLDLIAVVDLEERQLLWSWGPGELDHPHHPSVMANGNVLIFDNRPFRTYSRLVELEPSSKDIVWQYTSEDPRFYSETRGSAQELPNGNILVGQSDRGRWFEITKTGRIVWEFWPTEAEKAQGGDFMRFTIYRAHRFVDGQVLHPELRALWDRLSRVTRTELSKCQYSGVPPITSLQP